MRAAYLKAPFEFEVKDIALREIREDEVLIRIKACSVCGHDMILASNEGKEWQPFGHEVSGVVEKAGSNVKNVRPGDRIVLESGTYDRYSDWSRNGRADLDNKGPNFWLKDDDTMGFADYIIVPNEVCVKFDGISFMEASMAEPMGVALDLVYTADIKLSDDVLVIGLGPIGLMALRIAKAMGARRVYGAELSTAVARIDMARKLGANDVILTDKVRLEDYQFEKGGVDRVLVTAPPKTIPSALNVAKVGAIIAFLGIEYGQGGCITLDTTPFHVRKLQLRSSFASPALYIPRCIELIREGTVNVKDMFTHIFKLEDIAKGIKSFKDDRSTAIKAVMTSGEE